VNREQEYRKRGNINKQELGKRIVEKTKEMRSSEISEYIA
jgi:hypothetical protein